MGLPKQKVSRVLAHHLVFISRFLDNLPHLLDMWTVMLHFRGPPSKRHGSMSGAIASLGVGKLADKLLEDGQNLKDCSTSTDF